MDQTTRRTVYTLRFEHHENLRVVTRKPSLRGMQLLARAVGVLGGDLSGRHVVPEDKLDAWGWLADAFADALVFWDLRDFGQPVPPTRAGVSSQDLEFVVELATTWYRRVATARERTAEPEQPESAPDPAVEGPSVEELALLNIPVEIGNHALEADPVDVSA